MTRWLGGWVAGRLGGWAAGWLGGWSPPPPPPLTGTRPNSATLWTLLNLWLSLGLLFPPSYGGWQVTLHGSLHCPENE